MDLINYYDPILLAICVWREARGEPMPTKQAVAMSIRNRVKRPGWWGHTWSGIILMPWQYSSFSHNDPNATKFAVSTDPSWTDSLIAASLVYTADVSLPCQISDTTGGADSYFDKSLDGKPPSWATDGSKVKTLDSGSLHFYKTL